MNRTVISERQAVAAFEPFKFVMAFENANVSGSGDRLWMLTPPHVAAWFSELLASRLGAQLGAQRDAQLGA